MTERKQQILKAMGNGWYSPAKLGTNKKTMDELFRAKLVKRRRTGGTGQGLSTSHWTGAVYQKVGA